MDKKSQEQEHEYTHSNKWLVNLLILLAIGALMLAACGKAADTLKQAVRPAADAQITTPSNQFAIAGGPAAAEAEQAALLSDVPCTPTGCILREEGNNAQWWADSWEKGLCRDHDPNSGEDWLVTYKVNNDQWRNADSSKVRFYAAVWSGYIFWEWAGKVQVENWSLDSGGGIRVCLSGDLFSIDVQGTYLWLQP